MAYRAQQGRAGRSRITSEMLEHSCGLPVQMTLPRPDRYPVPVTGRLRQKVLLTSMPAVREADWEVALMVVVYKAVS